MNRVVTLVLAGLVASAPVAAAERPSLVPARDAVVEYRVQGKPNRPPIAVRAHFSAGGRLRADPADLAGYLIVDRPASRATVVMPQQHLALEFPLNGSPAGDLLNGKNVTFVRRGESRVAGEACTEWDATAPQGRTARACITPDGLVLRGEGHDPRYGDGRLEAVSVAYAPQPAALFRPPEDFARIAVPTLPGLSDGGAPQ